MTKREFLDTVFALVPNEANAIMDAFDEYVDSNENNWTAKDDKIEVYCKGDDESDSGVVTWAGKDRVCAMWQDGSAGEVQKDELIKTGRHFDIKSILEAMRYD